MRLSVYVYVFVALTPAAAFIVGPAARLPRQSRSTTHLFSSTSDEEKLDKMAHKWKELQGVEKEVEKSADESAAIDLLQNVLTTAIDYTRIREHVEEDHVASAHKALEKAMKLEDDLKKYINEAHHDADYADVVVGNYKTLNLGEDKELRRELVVSELSHHIENYAEERLHEAREAELHAKEEEDEAKRSLAQLAEKEKELKTTLEQLKEFRKEKEFYNELS